MEALRARLAEWRGRHRRGLPLPEEFWSAAVELARKHGLHRVARALPIDYARLKRRLGGAAKSAAAARPASFVELLLPRPAGAGSVVELLRVEIAGPPDWNELLRAWRRAGA